MKQRIHQLATSIYPQLVEIRRHIHAHPELSEQEFETAAFVCKKLTEYGIPFKSNVGGTGVVGEIKGKNPESRTIALRADMDALPIAELNQTEYASCNPGVMHACGHDVHVSCLLGAANILNQLKTEFDGTVRLIFQPSEEKFPGGALAMIKEGVLENPRPQAILGLHTLPDMDAGKVGFKMGRYMASTDEIYLTVRGKGGHSATPDLNVDTVLVASHIVVALQQIVSRNAPPHIPTVVSFGRFIADGRTNIIPDVVKIDGTIRTFDETWRKQAHEKIKNIATGMAESMGAICEVFIDHGYPFLVNDPMLTAFAEYHAKDFLGEDHVAELDLRMTAEDFAYYSHQIPACFYRLGVKNPNWTETRNLHTATFDVDERCLIIGSGTMAWLAVKKLG